MSNLAEYLPWLAGMVVLAVLSAFFSASEAALFYLRARDRRRMQSGTRGERAAARLLSEPDRLLAAVLLLNLLTNLVFFAMSSVVALKLEHEPDLGRWVGFTFAAGSLLFIIVFSEMFPKSLAVTRPAKLAPLVSIPMTACVRLASPFLPVLRGATQVSLRLVWPSFRPEAILDAEDLERAIQLSHADEAILRQEQAILRNIVHLSQIRVDEWMRPRTRFQIHRPPVHVADLNGELPPGGYLYISEPDSEEVDKAIRLDGLEMLDHPRLDSLAQPVVYLPWRATVADALQSMASSGSQVVVIVNERGETIGVLTFDDILETAFAWSPSRSKRILDLNPIHRIAENRWAISGMMSLKRLARHFGVEVPAARSVTVAGVIQECNKELIEPGDQCQWGPFGFRVIEAPHRDNILVELNYVPPPAEGET
jgi:CBS domain containing-hemolysin-like protein